MINHENGLKNIKLIVDIAKRAEKLNLLMFDRTSLIMDLEFANEEFDLRLDDFLNTDNFNFSHDIVGIQQNINRQTREMEGLFVPRFAGANFIRRN